MVLFVVHVLYMLYIKTSRCRAKQIENVGLRVIVNTYIGYIQRCMCKVVSHIYTIVYVCV